MQLFKGDNSAISCFELRFGLHVIAVHLGLRVCLSGQSGLPDPESLFSQFEKVSRLTPAYTTKVLWELSKVLKCTQDDDDHKCDLEFAGREMLVVVL